MVCETLLILPRDPLIEFPKYFPMLFSYNSFYSPSTEDTLPEKRFIY